MSLLIVTVDVSQWLVEPVTALGSLGVKTARHEIVVFEVKTVVLFVVNGALLSVNVPSTVPVQSALEYSVNSTVPLTGVPPCVVTVAESFGSQFCAVVTADTSLTVKHSVVSFVSLNGVG